MVVVVQNDTLQRLPPVLSLLSTLKALGEDVYFIGKETAEGRSFLEEHHIPHEFIPLDLERDARIRRMPLKVQYLYRFPRFLSCRSWLQKKLRSLAKQCPDLVVWFQQVHAAALLGDEFSRYPRRILTLFELQDRGGANWIGFDFYRFMRTTQVVVCEYNRAFLARSFYGLEKLPKVLTNKPTMHPREVGQPLPAVAKDVFERIGSRPVFLYQGYWDAERQDAASILETIAKYRPEYCVLSMPASDVVRKRLAHYKNAFVLPHIPAPGHLAITSRATVGVAAYRACPERGALGQLNSLYCAPNKIYEYAGYGIPTLCNDIPGLRYTVAASGAGVCCDCTKDGILSAADSIVGHLPEFRSRAHAFFDAIDSVEEVRQILLESRLT